MKPQDTLIWSHISEGGGKIEDAWKLVLAGGWLSSLFLGCSWPLGPPSARCPDRSCALPALSFTGLPPASVFPGCSSSSLLHDR